MRKDLTPLANDIEKVLKKHFPNQNDRIAMVIAFSLPESYRGLDGSDISFVSNVPRPIGIDLLRGVADKMQAQVQ